MVCPRTFLCWLSCVVALTAFGGMEGGRARAGESVKTDPVTAAPFAPPGQSVSGVLIEIFEEGVPENGKYPDPPLKPSEVCQEQVFGLFELPQKYISTGVRADRAFPTFVRMSARVNVPAGKHRLLLRSRGAARVSVNGKVVLENPFDQARQYPMANGGELPVEDQDGVGSGGLKVGPTVRRLPPGNRQAMATLEFSGKPTEVVFETLIGGREPKSKRPFRAELGEAVIAIAREGTDTWTLLSPTESGIAYTDEGWAAYEKMRREWLDATNAAKRAERRREHAAYWDQRRAAAREYLAKTAEISVPALPAGYPAFNAIDHFLAEKIAKTVVASARVGSANSVDFHREVKPLLEAKCFSCHQGSKVKGGLRLDVREKALLGGKVDGPAIVPHDPDGSALMQRITTDDPDDVMPAKGDRLSARDVDLLKRWIAEGAVWPEFVTSTLEVTALAADPTFLRRVYLDTVGVVPTEAEYSAFIGDKNPERRSAWIDRLLADPRWADNQMGYWLEVLAENPNLIQPMLNNTGPFRWWLYESFMDNKPLDLFVTELVRMEGSERFGGPAGFGAASQNDVPMAAKGIILGSAFLGVDMKCARCHDSPTHHWKQKDLFGMAAMLEQKPIKVPETSSVPMGPLMLGGRKPLIEVTLAPGSSVKPEWPFAELCDEQTVASIAEDPDNSRDRLAAFITAPQNERFAQVMANRIWQRLMGRGLVESLGDWEKSAPTHPELLKWLGRELVRSGYDMKAVARLILNSHAYQRAVDAHLQEPSALFNAPAPRRISPQQLVDSMFSATGKPFVVEPLNIDLDSIRTADRALDLGVARRAWMLPSASNERDRPSMMLPRIQAVGEVMEVFGWRSVRADPTDGTQASEPNVLQPALLANGTMMLWLTRLSDDHGLTHLALEDQALDQLVSRLFRRLFTREPLESERERLTAWLSPGYTKRVVSAETTAASPRRRHFVSWANHMTAEANRLRLEEESEARQGDAPTQRLDPVWRERFEDAIWALLNNPEWIYIR